MADLNQTRSPLTYVDAVHASWKCYQSIYLGAALVALSPFLLLLFNTEWFYDPLGWIDTYIFLGYFKHYLDPTFFPYDYKIARLPWILIGYVFNLLLPIVAAQTLLHVLCFSAAIAAMFLLVYQLFRSSVLATFISMALGFYTYFHGNEAAGWEYHNVPGGAFSLILMLLLAKTKMSGVKRARLAVIGIVATVCVLVNPLLINFAPLLLVSLIRDIKRTRIFASILYRIFWVAVGSLATIVALMSVNYLSGHQPNFLQNQFLFISSQLHHNPAHVPFSAEWLSESVHLSIPMTIALAGLCVSLLYARSIRTVSIPQFSALIVISLYIATLSVWMFWQYAGQEALTPEYFFYPQIPFCFLALAGFLYLGNSNCFALSSVLVGIFTAIAFIVPLCLVDVSAWVKATTSGVTSWLSVQTAIVVAVGLAAYLIANGSKTAFLVLVALLGIANSMTPWRPWYAYDSSCKLNTDAFRAIAAATDAIGRLSRKAEERRVWFEWEEVFYPLPQCPMRVDYLAQSIAAANAYFFPTQFPGTAPLPAPEVIPQAAVTQAEQLGLTIIVITRNESNVTRLQKRFIEAGGALELIDREVIKSGPIEFNIFALRAGAGRG